MIMLSIIVAPSNAYRTPLIVILAIAFVMIRNAPDLLITDAALALLPCWAYCAWRA